MYLYLVVERQIDLRPKGRGRGSDRPLFSTDGRKRISSFTNRGKENASSKNSGKAWVAIKEKAPAPNTEWERKKRQKTSRALKKTFCEEGKKKEGPFLAGREGKKGKKKNESSHPSSKKGRVPSLRRRGKGLGKKKRKDAFFEKEFSSQNEATGG